MLKFSIFVLLCLSIQSISTLKSDTVADETFRLPNNTIPLYSEIHLITYLHLPDDHPDKFKFDGSIKIRIRVLETSRYITLHTKQIDIQSVNIFNDNDRELTLRDEDPEVYDDVRELRTFHVKNYLYRNEEIILALKYNGTLREDNRGFYRSSFLDAEGNKKWVASTQFSAADARHAFPCYDEPQIRSVYEITITHHRSSEAISNNFIAEENYLEDGTTITRFSITPPMQTYILGFVIVEGFYITQDSQFTLHRIYGRREAIENGEGDFALDAGVKFLNHLQDYFNNQYPLGKMDQIAVPDFYFGAMENWGLITYRESSLLYDEKKPFVRAKRQIASTMAHEMTHQFFGNLVAPRYWYYVWLKEGFATFYSYEFLEVLYPELRQRDYMLIDAVQYSLLRDATEDTRPMTFFVKEPSEIYSNAGSFVYYQRGGSILRMFQMAISEETFRKAVSDYLENKKLDAADQNDLSRALENAARLDNAIPRNIYFKDVIDSWSMKSGYPVVTVDFNANGQIRLVQSKFTYYTSEPSDDLWYVPVTIATQSTPEFENTKPIVWFNTRDTAISQTEDLTWFVDDWVVVNLQGMGFFRVNYIVSLWNRISRKLISNSFQDIHHLSRAQLVDDALNLARTDLLSYYTALQVVEYLKQETDFIPWLSASTAFGYMNRLLAGSDIYDEFKFFINDLITPLYVELGMEDLGVDELLPEKLKRTIAINWACETGDQNCIDSTRDKVQGTMEDPDSEPASDVKSAIYCNGLRYAEESLFIQIWNRLETDKDQTNRRTLIQSLGCNADSDLQRTYLDTTLLEEQETYRQQEKLDVLNAVLMNGGSTGVESIIDFVFENHNRIEETFVGILKPVSTISRAAGEYVASEELLEKYKELLDAIEGEGLITDTEKEQFLRTAQINLKWVSDNKADIRQFLMDYIGRKSSDMPIVTQNL